MTTVLDELSGDEREIETIDVERRVDDWSARINSLYDLVTQWAPDLSADRRTTVPMHEKLMKKYSVGPAAIPVLNLYKGGSWIAKFVPRGLWIIGANGRLDLYAGQRHFLVVDRASNFSPPDWQVAPAERRRDLRPMARDVLREALGL